MRARMLLTLPILGALTVVQTPEDAGRLSFRLDVDFIEVAAVVTDANGRFVADLTAEDFEIREDGNRQEIAAFAFVDLPRRPRPRAPDGSFPEPDVHTNRELSGRLLVLFIDDLRTPRDRRPALRMRARELVALLDAGDLAAVVYSSGIRIESFTGSRKVLLDALGPTVGKGPDDDVDGAQVADIKTSLRTLEGVASLMRSVTGRRKTVVYFGPGSNYELTRMSSYQDAIGAGEKDRSYEIMMALKEAVDAANAGGISIYAVDPQGLMAPSGTGVTPSTADDPSGISENSLLAQRESLNFLAAGTGGLAVYNTNGFTDAFERIMEDNSRYYLLAYYPTNHKRDGKDRTIDVSMRDSSLRVRARQGYRAQQSDRRAPRPIAGPRGAPREVVELLRSPVPLADLPLRSVATRMPGENDRIAVVVELGVSALTFESHDGRSRSEVAFGFFLLGAKGNFEAGDGRSVRLDVDDEELEALRRNGLRLMTTLPVQAGRHQVAVAARERASGLAGLLYWNLEVPESDGPSVSDIVVSSAEESAVPVVGGRGTAVPTTRRTFAREDALRLFVPPRLGGVTARVGRLDGSTASMLRPDDGGEWRLPLADLDPGSYVLELTDGAGATRSLFFRVAGD